MTLDVVAAAGQVLSILEIAATATDIVVGAAGIVGTRRTVDICCITAYSYKRMHEEQ